jgi:hypothetical protein
VEQDGVHVDAADRHAAPRALLEIVVDRRDDAHDLGDLARFADPGRLVARKNLEDSLIRLTNSAEVTA